MYHGEKDSASGDGEGRAEFLQNLASSPITWEQKNVMAKMFTYWESVGMTPLFWVLYATRMMILAGTAACVSLCASMEAVGGEKATLPNVIIFFTDDHGYADLGVHGVVADIKTPHLDALAKSGVIFQNGYTTAPQCVPSRAGLLIGKFQGRFGVDNNKSSLEGFNQQTTIATRLQRLGYVTGQFGKWHLGPTDEIPQHGFRYVFSQAGQRPFHANITVDGRDRPMELVTPDGYHIDACTQAAISIIKRFRDQPLFLYIAYRAPHTPLDAPQRYLERFPGQMPERRRRALAMLSAVDDGVGQILQTLEELQLRERTMIFFISDNGAPLKMTKVDSPPHTDAAGWNGSLNDPYNGEKGMLTEGGIHVPFFMSWPEKIAGGQTYPYPVSTLDVAATILAQVGAKIKSGELDGVDLVPYLRGEKESPPHRTLMWRWGAQSAIREGNWKLLRGGDREYLFDLQVDPQEKRNLLREHPKIADRLRHELVAWCETLNPPGLSTVPMAPVWHAYFDFYLEGKPASFPSRGVAPDQGWIARNAELVVEDGYLRLKRPEASGNRAFIACAGLSLQGPVTLRLTLRADHAGEVMLAWRESGDSDFLPQKRVVVQWKEQPGDADLRVVLPVQGRLIHIRIHPQPVQAFALRRVTLESRNGQRKTWDFGME